MKRIATYLASAALGAALLVVSGSAWAQMGVPWMGCPYPFFSYGYGYPYPYGYFCATHAKTCVLRHASRVGTGCSCRVRGGRARGSVFGGCLPNPNPGNSLTPFGGGSGT
jgi:hypothetical protein